MAVDALVFNLWLMWIITAVVAMIFIVMTIVLFLFTPARTFLRAKMRHIPIIAAFRRDGKVDLTLAKEYVQGLVRTKKYGSFIVDEDGAYSEQKSGAVMLLACAEHGITKKPEWLDLIAAMKFSDYDCITDAKAANTSYPVSYTHLTLPTTPYV